jgi:hypothetical protein
MHPGLTVDGPAQKTLSSSDIDEIVAVSSRRDIQQPLTHITVDAPGKAAVQGGDPQKTGDSQTDFRVQKVNGRWTVVRGSILQTTITRIDHPLHYGNEPE